MKQSDGQQSDARDVTWPVYAVVGVVALLVRWLHMRQVAESPFGGVRLGDGYVYHAWARAIADGAWFGDEVFYQAPLYPYVLAMIYRVLGDAPATVSAVQVWMGTASCLCVTRAAGSLFGRGAAWIAGLGLALYAPALFLEALIQKTALAGLLFTILLALAARQVGAPRVLGWLPMGGVVGLLALTREQALLFVPVLLVWIVLGGGRDRWRRSWQSALTFLCGIALVLAPVALRNAYVSGELLVTTSQVGSNFYIGNHEDADGTYVPLRFGRGDARRERDDAYELARGATGVELSPREVSRYWLGRSLRFIGREPGRWLTLLGRKLGLAVHRWEVVDTEDQYAYAEWSWPLRWLGRWAHFGVLLPLGVFGLVATWSDRRRLWVFYLMLGGYLASLVAFYVVARYRFPLVPLLLLFAAGGASRIPAMLRAGAWRRLSVAGACGLLAVVATYLPLYERDRGRAVSYFNLAAYLAREEGRYAESVPFYERALSLQEGYAEAHYGWGVAQARLGDLDAAIAGYRRALHHRPGYVDAWFALATALAEEGRLADAIATYRKVLELDPGRAEAHNNLGSALARRGNLTGAMAHFERAIELEPQHAKARANLEQARRLLESP